MIYDGFMWGLGFLLALLFALVISVIGTMIISWACDAWVQRKIDKYRK